MKHIGPHRPAGLILAVAAAALAAPTAALAGPGCMNGQAQMVRGFYPQSPMMRPHPGYGQMTAYPYHAPPPPAMGMMAGPYPRRMASQRDDPRMAAGSFAQRSVGHSPGPGGTDASGEDEPGAETVTVRINGMQFQPASITVKPGTTVTWVHESNMPHTVSGKGDGPQSTTLYSGQAYSHTLPNVSVVALQPGTTDTPLSKPFQRNVPPGQLFTPAQSVKCLLEVLDGLAPGQSGQFLAFDGERLPW